MINGLNIFCIWLGVRKYKCLRAMQHSEKSIFVVEYLSEYESIFETALAYESVDPRALLDEKNQRLKISCDCPFKEPRRTAKCCTWQEL
jgi:hypothetical protein